MTKKYERDELGFWIDGSPWYVKVIAVAAFFLPQLGFFVMLGVACMMMDSPCQATWNIARWFLLAGLILFFVPIFVSYPFNASIWDDEMWGDRNNSKRK